MVVAGGCGCGCRSSSLTQNDKITVYSVLSTARVDTSKTLLESLEYIYSGKPLVFVVYVCIKRYNKVSEQVITPRATDETS